MNLPFASPFKRRSPRPLRAKLIFNANSGRPEESPWQLAEIISEMQHHQIVPEVYMVQPDCQIREVIHQAIRSGIRLIVAAGGDGTIDSVVDGMVGHEAVLGIIPTGTRNNVAFNLGIKGSIAESVALLREGRRLKVDMGRIQRGRIRHWFLEGVGSGLISDLYPMADNFQHGNITQIGEMVSTLVAATPSYLTINLDGHQKLDVTTHMVLIANMAYMGPRFQISPKVSFRDGYLDVFTFSDMSKWNMVSSVILARGGPLEDASIQHYRAREIKISSSPQVPVLADGNLLGEGAFSVRVHPRLLTVMAGDELTGEAPLLHHE